MAEGTCVWMYDTIYEFYETDCGNAFILEGTLQENSIQYCLYCGRRLSEPEIAKED